MILPSFEDISALDSHKFRQNIKRFVIGSEGKHFGWQARFAGSVDIHSPDPEPGISNDSTNRKKVSRLTCMIWKGLMRSQRRITNDCSAKLPASFPRLPFPQYIQRVYGHRQTEGLTNLRLRMSGLMQTRWERRLAGLGDLEISHGL